MHHDSGCADLAPKVAEDQRQCERRACHPHTLTKPRRRGSSDIQLKAAVRLGLALALKARLDAVYCTGLDAWVIQCM